MKIKFIGNLAADAVWFKEGLPNTFDPVMLELSTDFANLKDKEGLFVYVHDWVVGRLEPGTVKSNIAHIQSQLGRKIDAVLVLRAANHNGTDVALVSLNGIQNGPRDIDVVKVGYVAIDIRCFYQADRNRFFALLREWHKSILGAQPAPISTNMPASRVVVSADRPNVSVNNASAENTVHDVMATIQDALAKSNSTDAYPFKFGYAGTRYKIQNKPVPRPIKEIYDLCLNEDFTPIGKLKRIQESLKREMHKELHSFWRNLWLILRAIVGRALKKETEIFLDGIDRVVTDSLNHQP